MLHSEKTNIEEKSPDTLLEIVQASNMLSMLAREPDKSKEFWHEMESNYIFSDVQVRVLNEWAITPIMINA